MKGYPAEMTIIKRPPTTNLRLRGSSSGLEMYLRVGHPSRRRPVKLMTLPFLHRHVVPDSLHDLLDVTPSGRPRSCLLMTEIYPD